MIFCVLTRRKIIISCFFMIIFGIIAFSSAHSLTAPSIVRAPGTYYMAHTQEKVVALTFDDGPNPIDTPKIMEILKEKKVRATFFVLGQAVKEYPDLVKRLVSEGHEIGNHSYDHDYKQRQLLREIGQTDAAVYAACGTHTYFYRPPGGCITKEQLDSIKKNGQVVVLWSVDSKDWRDPGVNQIVKNVMDHVFPGAIILMHDGGYRRTQTVKALATVIDSLKSEGYRIVTLSELKALDNELK